MWGGCVARTCWGPGTGGHGFRRGPQVNHAALRAGPGRGSWSPIPSQMRPKVAEDEHRTNSHKTRETSRSSSGRARAAGRRERPPVGVRRAARGCWRGPRPPWPSRASPLSGSSGGAGGDAAAGAVRPRAPCCHPQMTARRMGWRPRHRRRVPGAPRSQGCPRPPCCLEADGDPSPGARQPCLLLPRCGPGSSRWAGLGVVRLQRRPCLQAPHEAPGEREPPVLPLARWALTWTLEPQAHPDVELRAGTGPGPSLPRTSSALDLVGRRPSQWGPASPRSMLLEPAFLLGARAEQGPQAALGSGVWPQPGTTASADPKVHGWKAAWFQRCQCLYLVFLGAQGFQ